MNYSDYKIEDWVTDDAFIRYVNGESSQEFERLKEDPSQSENIEEAKKIIKRLQSAKLDVSPMKLDRIFEKVNHNLNRSDRPRAKIVNMKWVGIAAAAVTVFLIALPFFMASNSNHMTTIAQQSEFKLPDNSMVHLNSVSSIQYNRKSWKRNRYLVLEGEAFFEVEKGSNFMVKSNQGIVTVLGTKFNIRDRLGSYEVEVVEGKVRVALTDGKTYELKKGDRLSQKQGQQAEVVKNKVKKIDWMNRYVELENEKMEHVLDELSRHFVVKFANTDSIIDKSYSGFFTTKSLDSALQQIFWPMDIEYEIDNDKVKIK